MCLGAGRVACARWCGVRQVHQVAVSELMAAADVGGAGVHPSTVRRDDSPLLIAHRQPDMKASDLADL